ncbi:hypothetical protein [Desulfobacter sp.]|uniref:hypothetical protein n=1 Tax=Desulfobacter sp. TaxID=2294 RepID=UPI003D0CB600
MCLQTSLHNCRIRIFKTRAYQYPVAKFDTDCIGFDSRGEIQPYRNQPNVAEAKEHIIAVRIFIGQQILYYRNATPAFAEHARYLQNCQRQLFD